jgi:hypothetical protein
MIHHSLLLCMLTELSAAGAASPAATPPYPPSSVVTKLTWDPEVLRIGGGSTGDNWPITWGRDDAQYAAYGDGRGFGNRDPRLTIGFVKILGDPPSHRGEDLPTNIDAPEGQGPRGIKASGLLSVDGVLYLFVRNYRLGEEWRHARLASSRDQGKTWTWAEWHFSDTFGCPDFVQFGRDYDGARDGYVYLVSTDTDDAYAYVSSLVLARVPRDAVTDRSRYEFYAGTGPDGAPRWSARLEERRPIFTDRNGTQRVSITYNAALRRYFLTTSHVGPSGKQRSHTSALGVFDAPEPWGPWTTVSYEDRWSGDTVTFHHKFPTKWMSADGRTMWLVFSGLGGGNYRFCVRKATLTVAPPHS